MSAANPFNWAGLGIGLGMAGLGGLFGSMAGDPQAQRMRLLQQLMSPEAMFGAGQKFYNNSIASPYGVQGMQNAFNSGSMYSNSMARALARSGLGGTGVGAMRGAYGNQMANRSVNAFRGGLWNNSMQLGMQNRQGLAQMIGGMPIGNPLWMQMMGAGFQAIPSFMGYK